MMKMSEQEFIEISEMIHEWRDVEGYEGLYRVSEYGDVMAINYRNTGEKRILKQSDNGKGYKFVHLTKDGKSKTQYVHRLVATAFCEGSDYFTVVNHMDEDPTNNHYTNLEWCTTEYNINYGTRNEKCSKKVRCIELDIIFDSVSSAAEYVNTRQAAISACLVGLRKTHRGFHWEFVS